MKIRTAIFVVYVAVSAAGFVVLMGLVLRDVRLCYVESMRRMMGNTAVLLAALTTEGPREGGGVGREAQDAAVERGAVARVCERRGRPRGVRLGEGA